MQGREVPAAAAGRLGMGELVESPTEL
jgi:hypothetical protein